MTPLSTETQPFVLLDDARATGAADARLFRKPRSIIQTATLSAVGNALIAVDAAIDAGHMVAGYIAYESGYALDHHGMPPPMQAAASAPLVWFGVFDTVERVPSHVVPSLLPDPADASLDAPEPQCDFADYASAIGAVLDYIQAGDIYQANLTFAAAVPVHGHPLAAYTRLRARAQAGYGGVVYTGDHWHLSASPELFFSLRGDQLVAKPMKGTARRGDTPDADAAIVHSLAHDPKQRAENLMIVDLLRNDLSRIAVPGSVRVPELFRVETYPTIHQMISVIIAQRRSGISLGDILRHIFPCGSITGAPKLRAMEIIAEVEAAPRGLYTGSIGYAASQDDAAFNVAIRTLSMPAALPDDLPDIGPRLANLGLGSGIVADSVAQAEWDECLAKGGFVGGDLKTGASGEGPISEQRDMRHAPS